jgi:hypothetical protein
MRRIEHLSTQIREHTYPWNSDMRDRYFQSRRDDWNLLCVAMDTLDDTSLALEDYEAAGLGTESGGKYLRLYGMLQAVFLQQDCIRNLHKLFGDTDWTPSIDSRWQGNPRTEKFNNRPSSGDDSQRKGNHEMFHFSNYHSR